MKWHEAGGGDFEQAPVGTYAARCIRMIDIGTQRSEYQGQPSIKRQCIIGFELPMELMTEGDAKGKPFVVSRFFTASLSKKANLRRELESWRGRAFTEQELMGFESKNIIGKPCMLSLIANDKGKTRISGIMAMPKGMTIPPQVNPSMYFSLDEYDAKTFESLSDGIKKLIQSSPEWLELQRSPGRALAKDDLEEGFESDEAAF